MYKTNILSVLEACVFAALPIGDPLLQLLHTAHSPSFVHSSTRYVSTINQPSQFFNNILHHRIRPSLDLQSLRQRQSLDVRVDLASPGQDCVALLGCPHRGCELGSRVRE